MKTKEFKNYRAYVWAQIKCFLSWLVYPFRWIVRRTWRKIVNYHNQQVLCSLANLRPDAQTNLTQDESVLLETMAKLIQPSRFVTRKGKIIYTVPELEDITLWQMIEARRAESALERIAGWTEGYAPETIADMMKLTKYIAEQIGQADELERVLLPGGGGSGESNPISEAKSVLNMVQTTAELFNCSFEDAKKINYSDAVLAISKRHDEVEKQKSKNR